jgi:uncharacterized OsmC-like protein
MLKLAVDNMIKANAKWLSGYLAEVDDGRGHTIKMDLPEYQNGTDIAASALEYMVMGYAGCTVTVFKMITDKMRLSIDAVEIKVDAEKLGEMETVTKMESILTVKTNEPEEKIRKAVEMTKQTCPVGRIYDLAKIPTRIKLVIETP